MISSPALLTWSSAFSLAPSVSVLASCLLPDLPPGLEVPSQCCAVSLHNYFSWRGGWVGCMVLASFACLLNLLGILVHKFFESKRICVYIIYLFLLPRHEAEDFFTLLLIFNIRLISFIIIIIFYQSKG